MSFPSELFAGMPRDEGSEPVFREPWEAHAFAMAVSLHAKGLFTWPEWAQALAEQITRAQSEGDADRGDTYYHHWLATLETLVSRKGASSEAELASYRDAWHSAAHRTPHGKAIELREQDFAR